MATPHIPFEIPLAGEGPKIDPSSMDSWVRQEDRVPLSLAISLYSKPIEYLSGYTLVPGSYRTRVAAWFNTHTGIAIVGFRGTAIGQSGGKEDLKDDKVSLIIFYFF